MNVLGDFKETRRKEGWERWCGSLFLAGLLSILLVLTGCGAFGDREETKDWTVERFYQEAKQASQEGNYQRAAKLFEQLEAKFPYGKYAQAALLEGAYANYKQQDPAIALANLDRFIKLYPNHPALDYAYYLKGLVNFIEDLGFMSFLADQDMSERDPKAAKESFESFKQLVAKFPESKYSSDAVQRMRYLANALANHEIQVARYYYKRGAYVAATNRAQQVLLTYPETPSNEEALVLLIKSYDILGMTDLRDDSKRVLERNFPNSAYLSQDYAGKPWWKFW